VRYGVIRPLLTLKSTNMVARGNNGNYGTSSDNLLKLQVTQNALARVNCMPSYENM